jgi:hypothetical protein
MDPKPIHDNILQGFRLISPVIVSNRAERSHCPGELAMVARDMWPLVSLPISPDIGPVS